MGRVESQRGRISRVVATFLVAASVVSTTPANAFDPAEDRPWRIAGESLGGVVGGAAGVFSVGLLSYGSCALVDGGGRGFGCLVPAVLGAYVGGAAGVSLGVWGAGELAGANGGFGWTLLGTLSGTTVAVTTLLLSDIEQGDPAWWLLFVGLPLTGAIVGYELSTEPDERTAITTGTWSFLF